MRKPVEAPLGQLGLIADHFPFNGIFDVENDFLSEISFYDYGDDSTADEQDESHDVPFSKKKQEKLSPSDGKNVRLAKTIASRVRDGEKQALKKIQKGRKPKIEISYEQNASDNDIKSDSDACEEPYSFVRRQPKLPKKQRGGSTSFDDFEDYVKADRIGKFLETTPKTKRTVSLYGKFGSEFGGENARDSKIKEEILMESSDVREVDDVKGKTTVQAFQRKKKLCKAADLKPASEKGHKGKNKGYLAEMKQKTAEKGSLIGKDHASLNAIQKNRLKDYSSDSEDTAKASLRKNFKQGLTKEQKFAKDENELVRAAISGEGQSIVRKTLVGTGHAVKQREFRHEDVAGSSSTGKRQGLNQHSMPPIVRSKKKTAKDLCISLETVHSVAGHQKHALEKFCDNGVAGEEVSSGVTEGAEGNKELLPYENGNVDAEVAGMEVGWVMCDSCKKWRCIPASLIEMIESTNCGWFCKDNPNKKFADCSVPQEKTNTEINRELNLSEVSFCEEGDEKHPAIDSTSMNGVEHQSQPHSTWTLIKHNIFQHRCRKTETLDEKMVCMCKPSKDGSLGCGEDCHNRMLNIECGFGLQVLEDIPKGAFIIEYVGEVLNMASYEARQKRYALGGQKHFYFMTLNSSEIIDACYKGNLGRFINHSCEPNCTTEKWMVNGEVCIGLFAVRDLKKVQPCPILHLHGL
ncbi:hypothetical protein GOP47_0020005 [Adiantum capillus-veneris]|uniref:Uncharacterized protein n=1 Tax=Adiantum capillus-veneris TaxID=13818 RepID=A0A9D4UCL7_ADICA|nr:hypothetical protein GOP47_0020005 [Adiantum capillus-veneris]